MKETGSPQPFKKNEAATAQLLFFHDETEDWRIVRKERLDEEIKALQLIPMTKDGERHDVVWLERKIPDPITGDLRVTYHAACKCIADKECQDDPDLTVMFECESWKAGVITRALDVNRQEGSIDFGKMLSLFVKIDDVDYGQVFPPLELNPVDEAILLHLENVSKHPFYWDGNAVGGEHNLPLLSIVTGHHLFELSQRAQALSDSGWVQFDGDQTIRLAA